MVKETSQDPKVKGDTAISKQMIQFKVMSAIFQQVHCVPVQNSAGGSNGLWEVNVEIFEGLLHYTHACTIHTPVLYTASTITVHPV